MQVSLAVIDFRLLLHRLEVALLALITVQDLLLLCHLDAFEFRARYYHWEVAFARLLRGLRGRAHEIEVIVPNLDFYKVLWPLGPFQRKLPLRDLCRHLNCVARDLLFIRLQLTVPGLRLAAGNGGIVSEFEIVKG